MKTFAFRVSALTVNRETIEWNKRPVLRYDSFRITWEPEEDEPKESCRNLMVARYLGPGIGGLALFHRFAEN
jgi:hypothetical protein